ncbi:hypothetical protein [Mucilaginibacter sp.]|uniref:hypothetical protein n=1 Tax=Mucilaginibacter sp. TaxID=1882438 RepID=UPI002617153B|nr:hypothetical protein [Mucilaginibacter sp.]MDB5128342.1 hypothetical protein [Mucilaginibacter sp.]
MHSKPIHSELKPIFKKIYESGKQRAITAFKVLEDQAAGLDDFDRLLILDRADQGVEKQLEDFEHPYYADNSGEETLLSYFASRTYLLSVDESAVLEEGVFLGQFQKLLSEAMRPLEDTIPKYTFEDFLNGVSCRYFENFKKEVTTDEANYYAIRDWQFVQLQKVVTYEYLFLASKLQSIVAEFTEPLLFLMDMEIKVRFMLDRVELEEKLVSAAFNELSFLNNVVPQPIDTNELTQKLTRFRNFDLDLMSIMPSTMDGPLLLVAENYPGCTGNILTLIYALDQLADWLDEIKVGRLIWTDQVKELDWAQIAANTRNAAAIEVDALTLEIEETAYNEDVPQEEIKQFLIGQFEHYRERFNRFKNKFLFAALKDDKDTEHTDRMVITNSFFGHAAEGNFKELKEAIIIKDMIWVIVQIYMDVMGTHRLEFANNDNSFFAVQSLLSTMVPDKELYNAMSDTLTNTLVQHESYFLPFDLFIQNHKENFHHIFHRGIDRLQGVLDDAVPNNKILYIQSRLKDLKQRELKLSRFTDNDREFGSYDDRYSTHFKEFLDLEAEFMRNVRDVEFQAPIKPANKPTKKLAVQDRNHLFNEDQDIFIAEMMESLGLTRSGRASLSERKKGAVRGIVEALSKHGILPLKSLDELCHAIAVKIGLELKSKLDFSQTSQRYEKLADTYIQQHYKAR